MKKLLCFALAVCIVLSASAVLALEGPIRARFVYHSLLEKMASEGIDVNDNRIANFHRENSGIDVQFEYAVVDGTEEKQLKAMMLASGDAPDLMIFDNFDYFQYAIDGVLTPTSQYLENMPNYMALVPQAARDACMINGELYALPGSHEEAENYGGDGIDVRKDLFDTLGLDKEPQTLDEYFKMWKLVQEKYPDMIPFIGNNFNSFKAAYGVLAQTKAADDGSLYFTWASPAFKDYLTYMAKLYAEGILDKEYVNSSTANLQEKFLNNIAFSTCTGWATNVVTINGVFTSVPGSELAYLTFPTVSSDKPAELTKPFPSQRINAIPASSQNGELVAKFLEYMATPEAKRVQDRGIEGIDYKLAADGSIEQTLDEQNAVGWKIVYEWIPTPASFQVRLFVKGFDWSFYGNLAARERSNVIGVEDALTFLPPSEDYLNLQQQLGLKAYSDEQADKFIMGERSIDEFDAYLDELEARGLTKLTDALNVWAASVK